jgi:hypothetical protein
LGAAILCQLRRDAVRCVIVPVQEAVTCGNVYEQRFCSSGRQFGTKGPQMPLMGPQWVAVA